MGLVVEMLHGQRKIPFQWLLDPGEGSDLTRI